MRRFIKAAVDIGEIDFVPAALMQECLRLLQVRVALLAFCRRLGHLIAADVNEAIRLLRNQGTLDRVPEIDERVIAILGNLAARPRFGVRPIAVVFALYTDGRGHQ